MKKLQAFGVNQIGNESGNDQVASEKHGLPWLQDQPGVDVWNQWRVEFRDIVIVDAKGREVMRYNVTRYTLTDPKHYEELKEILRKVAKG